MKVLFLALALVLTVGTASAQYSTTIYTDTTLAGQITDAQSAAALTRGFTGYTTLRSDANSFVNRFVQFSFRGKTSRTLAAATSFTKDSVKLQGRLVKKTAANKMDTVWVDIPLKYRITAASAPGAGGFGEQRDTTCTWFAAGQTGIGNAEGYISPIMQIPNYYEEYRLVNGTKDSGRVVLKEIFERVR